ncbi:putative atp-dependent rna helicase dbp6 protein [Botrytis fragariae]|uniref:ATP-dependent RNA helicase n=1 Tax=Botrytis fragariae TaxID=1964551 RepID=A0A8H6B4G4_9HELO|nr:putative atp-dependent rna helicase dbp6 protein [Botrytis fragariae]KAF5879034.1 putative atp-dependent rna helicase dbp6 protein [Botrytis fragariae]
MYSRYVPPSKKKVTTQENSIEAPPSPPKSSSPPLAPPATRPDASSTYARYVPPSKSKPKPNTQQDAPIAAPESPSPASKRKHEDVVQPTPEPISKKARKEKKEKSVTALMSSVSEEPHNDTVSPEEAQEVTRKDKKSKKSKSKIETISSRDTAESNEDIDDTRHKRVLEKREKSIKKAERRARKAAEEGVVVENAQEPEEPGEIHDLVPLPQPEPIPELPPPSLESTLPSWLASPILVSPTTTAQFSVLGVEVEAANVLRSKSFNEAFAVQAAVLPLLLPGSQQKPGDVLVSAATGSGKTLSYVLPMTQDISRNTVTRLRGLIVMPTRELVSQAREVCEVCSSAFSAGSRKRVKIGTAVGNEAFKVEQANLVENTYRYDPILYHEQEERKNSRWESSDAGIDDEGEPFFDDETASPLPDHVIEPVSKVDILICTPGRLVEHLKSTPGFTLQHVKWLVIDEADKLLDQSFQQWLDIVMNSLAAGQKSLPSNKDRVRKIVLSATMTRDIGQLTSLKLYRPKLVVLEGSSAGDNGKGSQAHVLPSGLTEFAVKVDDENLKPLYLIEILKGNDMIDESEIKSDTDTDSDSSSDSSSDEDSSEDSSSSDDSSESDTDSDSKPDSRSSLKSKSKIKTNPLPINHEPHGVLIFTKSNESAIRLGRLLSLINDSYTNIIGTLTSTTRSSERRASIASFSRGKLQILVASDLVSRGLDLPDLAHVINYDVPTSITNYVHRVGRTARAGRQGSAWTLVGNTEARWFFNEVAKSEGIRRKDGEKVKRVVVDARKFGEYKKETYEDALEELGQEAMAIRKKKSG